MNSNVKDSWTTALRSGEYKQGTHFLKGVTPEGQAYHCCLGVLCELYIKEHPTVEWELAEDSSYKRAILGCVVILPDEVVEWSGLETFNPMDSRRIMLSQYNDDGESFDKIAEIIDKDF